MHLRIQRTIAMFLSGALFAGALVVAGGNSGAVSGAATAQAINLNLADVLSATDPGTVALNNLASLVSKATDDGVHIKVYPQGQLASEKTIVSALRTGTVDMGLAAISFWTELVSGIDALGWPYVVTSWQQASALATSDAINSYYRSVFTKYGVVFVAALPYTWKELIGTQPVNGPGDLRGMKIRTAGGTGTAFLPLFGAAAPVLTNAETYQALLTHTITQANISTSQAVSLKLYEVAKYYTAYHLYMIWLPVFVNQGAWQKLAKPQQDAILQAGQEMVRQHVAGAAKTLADQQQLLTSNGVHLTMISDFTPWKNVVAPAIKQKTTDSAVAQRLLDLADKATSMK